MWAERLERAVAEVIAARLEETGFAITLLEAPTAVEIDRVRAAAAALVDGLLSERRGELLAALIAGGSISSDAIAVELDSEALATLLEMAATRIDRSRLSIVAPWRIRRRGVETRFVIDGARREINDNRASKIGLAHRWFDEMKAGGSVASIATRETITKDRVAQILRLAWLAPEIVEAIASGRQPARLTASYAVSDPADAMS